MIARRTAGSDGCAGGPGLLDADFFPRPRGLQQAAVLEIGKRHQAEQRVMVQPQPGAALEVVQAELVLELLGAPARSPSAP